MSFSLVYLVHRLFYRIYQFLHHWYVGGFMWFVRHTVDLLEALDRFFAFRVTLRYWLKPLYQDYTVIGYVLGFIFRTGRLIFGGIFYLLILFIAALLYVIWAAIPAVIIYKGFFQND